MMPGAGYGPGDLRFDPYLRRPFLDDHGQSCVMVDTGRRVYNTARKQDDVVLKKVRISELNARGIYHPVWNTLTLPKNTWIHLDDAIFKATRLRLKAWADLSSRAGVGGFDAMSKLTYEYQSVSDAGEAVVDMYASADARTDRPVITLSSIPLPITHSDFWFDEREIMASRASGMPLDTTMAEMAGRRVAETIEKTLIGVETGLTYGSQTTGVGAHTGTSTVWGYTNFPYRVTKTDLNTPTGTNPEAVKDDVLEMVSTMQDNGYYGPYILYHSTSYSRFLSDDYFRSGSTSAVRSLRERIMEIEGISAIERLDYLTSGYQLVLIQPTSDVAQALNGMQIRTVRWEGQGGSRQYFRVMGVMVPLLRKVYKTTSTSTFTSGVLHATTS